MFMIYFPLGNFIFKDYEGDLGCINESQFLLTQFLIVIFHSYTIEYQRASNNYAF